MGFFRAIAGAAKEANEEAHGERLLREVQSTLVSIENLDGRVLYVAMQGYLQIHERLIEQMINWSSEGRIKIGRTMQQQARNAFNTDMAGGYAKWLGGAWLESKERNSLRSQQAYSLLQNFADYIRNEIEQLKR